jgi:antitoxin ParD1/3/4/toxin ParE1/3/4
MNFFLSSRAARDIESIWDFIAEDNLDAAGRVRVAILDACRKLGQNPYLGHVRQDLTPAPLRFWAVYSYLIVYNPESRPIEIVSVFHGARDVGRILS